MSRRGYQRFNDRRDKNEPEIIAALQAQGFSVERVTLPGGGDLLVGKGRHFLRLVEVKGKGGVLTPSQKSFRERWRGPQPILVRTVEDVSRFMLLAAEKGEA